MSAGARPRAPSYEGPTAKPGARLELVATQNGEDLVFPFEDRLEIGRWTGERGTAGEMLLIHDPTVSFRHCVLSRHGDGDCFVQDTSRNGTWLDGRRLVPNAPVRIRPGQILSLGTGHRLLLRRKLPETRAPRPSRGGTLVEQEPTDVTVLVGDIRDYTALVQRVPPNALQAAVAKVFERLEGKIEEHGGTVKEYQGDAVFAFWEQRPIEECAATACRAALALDRLGETLARDRSVWPLEGFPLRFDWALTSGRVIIMAQGASTPMGLSMIGPVVPLAFRLEKLANEETGSILACERTRELARDRFAFRDLGRREIKGFDEPIRVYALADRAARER